MAATVSGRRGKTTRTQLPERQLDEGSRPSEDEVRILAYRLYERRREEGNEGDAETDWIEAERRLGDK